MQLYTKCIFIITGKGKYYFIDIEISIAKPYLIQFSVYTLDNKNPRNIPGTFPNIDL